MRAALLLLLLFAIGVPGEVPPDPWPPKRLVTPAELAKVLESRTDAPVILMVGPRVLFRGSHIRGALFAGPASSPEGLQLLATQAAGLSKESPIILYCGCCPMENCPNIRPAYKILHDAGFTNMRVLNIPTNLPTDWTAKGYPVEKAASSVSN